MITRMFGGLCCWATAGALAAVMATNDASSPRKSFLVEHMACFLSSGCPNWAGSRRPVRVTPNVRRDGMQPLLRRETRKPLHPCDGRRVHPHFRAFRADSRVHAHILHRRRYGGAITGPRGAMRNKLALSLICLQSRAARL